MWHFCKAFQKQILFPLPYSLPAKPESSCIPLPLHGERLESVLWDILEKQSVYKRIAHDPCYFSTSALGLRSPLNLPDIEKALAYLSEALGKEVPICVVGDRDVDGVSSTALLASFLKENHKGPLECIVSDQGDDYGLSGAVFEKVRAAQFPLVILLDMGSSHGPEIASLYEQGQKVIILDHHQLHEGLPDPEQCAFVNPQRNVEEHLQAGHGGKIATAGLVFKLLFAMALSHTKEWRRLYVLTMQGKEEGFRCGHYLALPPRFQDYRAWAQHENWEYINLGSMQSAEGLLSLGLGTEEREYIAKTGNKDYAAKCILATIVERRPRLCRFVQNIADLAALGTLADMVPLVDENRALVRIGMGQALCQKGREGRRSYRVGYASLMKEQGLASKSIYSRDLAWSLGPALNAAGRMGNTRLALELLLCQDPNHAQKLAHELVKLNESRKKRTKSNEQIISRQLEQNPAKLDEALLFCYDPQLEPGVSGIIATRLTEKYKKPVVYINNDGDYARGSARSWDGCNVLDLLDKASSLFIQFGGHPEAAGFSIHYEDIPRLEQILLYAAREALSADNCVKEAAQEEAPFALDLQSSQISYRLFHALQNMEPFGAGNPAPLIRIKEAIPMQLRYMREGLHVSFKLEKSPPGIRCIAWRKGELMRRAMEKRASLDLYGYLELDRFRSVDALQLRVENIL